MLARRPVSPDLIASCTAVDEVEWFSRRPGAFNVIDLERDIWRYPSAAVSPVDSSSAHNPPSWLYGTQLISYHSRVRISVAHIHRPDTCAGSDVKHSDCCILRKLGKVQLIVQKQ
ncbi:hypothetical protein N0V86_002197 [Didymella sp. IMI 355093]|nr:hypothetical protein N0V86_002197 [Didymella sp. IMI 355093]